MPGKGEGLQRHHWLGKTFLFEEGGAASCEQNYEVDFIVGVLIFFLLKCAVAKVVCGNL